MQHSKNHPLPEAKDPPSLDERAPPNQPPNDPLLAVVLENTHMSAAYLDTCFNFIWVNRAYAKAGGKAPAFFVGRNHFDLYPDAESQAIFQRVVDTGQPFFTAARPFVFADRPERGTTWWDWSLVPVKDEAGKATGLVLTLEEVTDQVSTRRALRQSEANLIAMIEASSDSAFLVDAEGVVVVCNKAGAERVGGRMEDILGRSIFDLVSADVAATRRTQLRRVVDTGATVKFQDRRQGHSFSHHLCPILDENNQVSRVAIFSHDITELQHAKNQLEARNDLLAAIGEAQALFISGTDQSQVYARMLDILVQATKSEYGFLDEVACDPDGRPIKCSLAISAIAWDTPSRRLYEELRSKRFEFHHLDNLAGAPVLENRTIIANDAPNDPHAKGLPKGHPAIRRYMGIPLYLGGEIIGVVGVANRPEEYTEEIAAFIQPLTQACTAMIQAGRAERRQREALAAIEVSEARYRRLAENITDVVWVADLDMRITYVSPSVARMVGEPVEAHLGRSMREKFPPQDLERLAVVLAEELEREKDPDADPNRSRLVEARHYRADGSLMWVGMNISFLRDEKGTAVGLQGVTREISERKQVEDSLKTMAEMIDNAPSSITIHDAEGRFFYANRKTFEIHGYGPEEFMALNLHRLDVPESEALLAERLRLIAQRGEATFEVGHFRKDGSVIPLEVTAKTVSWNGRPAILSIASDISERKQAREAQETLRSRLSQAVAIARLGYWHYDVDRDLFHFDDAFYRIYRTTAAQAGGYSLSPRVYAERFVHPLDRHLVAEENRRALETQDPGFQRRLEHRILYADGTVGWVSVHYFVVKDAQGRTIRTYGVNQDITERKLAEQALADSERKWRHVLVNIPQIGISLDPRARIVFANSFFLELTGWTEPEVLGRDWFDTFIPESSREAVRGVFERVMGNRDTMGFMSYENQIVTRTGELRNIAWSNVLTKDPAGEVLDVTCLGVDLTERKRAEDLLRRGEEKYRLLTETMSDIVWTADLQLRTTYVSPSIVRVLGFTPEERMRQTIQEQIAPASLDYGMARFAQEMALEEQGQGDLERRVSLELEYWHKDGSTRWMDTVVSPIRDGRGRLIGLHGVSRDVTDRRQAEARSRQLSDIIDKSLNEIYIFDCQSLKFRHVNQGALNNLQYTLAQIRAMTPVDLKPEFTEATFRAMIQPLLDGTRPALSFETLHRRADGSDYPVEIHLQLMEAEGERVFLAVIFDIRERREAEAEREKLQAQLLQAQKMESVGRLAGGVAHDFNNMLGVILGYAELALDQIETQAPLFECLQEIRKAAERSAKLTRQLLAFARKQTASPRVLDLNDTVEGMLQMLRRLIGEDIDLRWLPGARLWPVRIDPSQIDQILANLCVNARDAIAGVGRVTIRTGTGVFDAAYCAAHPEFSPGQFVMLAVSDDGCGMDAQTCERLFEPFFTTKPVGQGTGLGLPTVYGIVRQNNGFIQVESRPGQGTTLRIYLPRHLAAPGEQAAAYEPGAPVIGGQETVLLVEDEPAILSVGQIMLERLGYRVLAASHPQEAVRLAKDARERIDLLITDVVMPGMNGRDLARRLQAHQPPLKVLFMSGYTADVITRQGVLEEGVEFIQKPFSYRELAQRVRGVLGHGAAAK
jgi:PAS domain S-box-containing protein